MSKKKSQGFKCRDCSYYIVPPQNYDPITINLCKCEEEVDEVLRDHKPRQAQRIVPMRVDPSVANFIYRQATLDDARKPWRVSDLPKYIKPPKVSLWSKFRQMAGVFSV